MRLLTLLLLLLLQVSLLSSYTLRTGNHLYASYPACCKHRRSTGIYHNVRPSGYIPPELDPEFRSNAGSKAKSASSTASSPATSQASPASLTTLPMPKEGDIVLFNDDFNDVQLGKIRYLRYLPSYQSLYADILPLQEVKSTSDPIFKLNKQKKAYYLPIDRCLPVKAYYIRADDGYRVYFQAPNNTTSSSEGYKNVKNVVLRASQYRKVTEEEAKVQPRKKAIDYTKLDNDFKDYDALKKRIATISAQIGVVSSVIIFSVRGFDEGFAYTVGVLSGLLYFVLLAAKVDAISSKYSALQLTKLDLETSNNATTASIPLAGASLSSRLSNSFAEKLSSLRYLTPALCLWLLAVKEHTLNPEYQGLKYDLFHLLPRTIFINAMFGFLTLRIALYISEVLTEFRLEDVTSMIPGNVGLVLSQWIKGEAADNGEEQDIYILPRRMICLTGPSLAGRNNVLLNLTKKLKDKSQIQFIRPLLVTDEANPAANKDGIYEVISKKTFEEMKAKKEFIFVGEDRDALTGQLIQVAFRRADFQAYQYQTRKEYQRKQREDEKNLFIVAAPASMIDALYRMSREEINDLNSDDSQAVAIDMKLCWISLQSKDQFLERLRARSTTNMAIVSAITLKEEEEVIQEAARDISIYMQKAPIFEATLLNNDMNNESVTEEILQLILNSMK